MTKARPVADRARPLFSEVAMPGLIVIVVGLTALVTASLMCVQMP
jgi:hypothetical protein